MIKLERINKLYYTEAPLDVSKSALNNITMEVLHEGMKLRI
jgi:hypothetical protein